jgi:hypothetical protein
VTQEKLFTKNGLNWRCLQELDLSYVVIALPIHNVSSHDFRSLSLSVGNFQHSAHLLPIFFVKLQCSVLKKFHLTNSFYFFILLTFFLKILIASYGARVRGRIFKMELI